LKQKTTKNNKKQQKTKTTKNYKKRGKISLIFFPKIEKVNNVKNGKIKSKKIENFL